MTSGVIYRKCEEPEDIGNMASMASRKAGKNAIFRLDLGMVTIEKTGRKGLDLLGFIA